MRQVTLKTCSLLTYLCFSYSWQLTCCRIFTFVQLHYCSQINCFYYLCYAYLNIILNNIDLSVLEFEYMHMLNFFLFCMRRFITQCIVLNERVVGWQTHARVTHYVK